MIRWTFLLVTVVSLKAQPITYGFKLGVPFNDSSSQAISSSRNTQSRWTGGPFLEYHLPQRLSVEFGALFRSSREDGTMLFPFGAAQHPYLMSATDKVRTLDLPLLLKYRFTGGKIRPYIGAGGAWSHRRSEFQATYTCVGPEGSCHPPDSPFAPPLWSNRNSTLTKFGPAASAGLDIKTPYVTLSPEVRWLRDYSGSRARNQFMVGVGFGFGR